MRSIIKGLHLQVPLRYTNVKSHQLTCLKTPPQMVHERILTFASLPESSNSDNLPPL